MTQPATETLRIGGQDLPVLTATTVVVGTGSAGYCAADRLWELGHPDVIVVTDKINAGASRNAGSDKQTYYKLTLSGGDPDSVREMAATLFAGGAMDGDVALAEAASSASAFLHLADLGVPFPQNRYGEYIGYKTDHDPRRRATSVGPYTSRGMVEALERQVARHGTPVLDGCRVVDVLTRPVTDGAVADGLVADGANGDGAVTDGREREVVGLLVLRTDSDGGGDGRFAVLRCRNLVYATGGPAGLYARRVFPHGQWGATGAALRAGVHGKNLTEWQFGLASTHPRWNVSGSYMQVLPRFVSTDADGNDEREFLTESIDDYGRLLSLVFLKGYQWPFDVRKAADGSSLIDLLVHRETVLRGRRVFLDFRSNPLRPDLDAEALSEEARTYLARAGALDGTPLDRLKRLNLPAYQFYLERNPGIDLAEQMLEVDVCAQHNNGGLVVDSWWQSNVAGFFPVGEAAGAHGVYRPGGAALNSGQVGATRAARYIAARRDLPPLTDTELAEAATPAVARATALLDAATGRAASGAPDNTGDLLRTIGELMSDHAGAVRSADSVAHALADVRTRLAQYNEQVVADGTSRRSIDRTFLIRDILTTAHVYLAAMSDYLRHGGRSRGSVLYTDPAGTLPRVGHGPAAETELALPDEFRFQLDGGALDDEVQEAAWAPVPGDAAGAATFHWRPRRPVPEDDDFFENVWREYRRTQNVR